MDEKRESEGADVFEESDKIKKPSKAESLDNLDKLIRSYSTQVSITLVRERSRLSLSQKELAVKTGLQQSLICHYETGRANPCLAKLIVLAHFFGIQVGDFFRNSSGLVQTFKQDDFNEKKILAPGFQVKDFKIANKKIVYLNIPSQNQIVVKVRNGQLLVRIKHLVDSYFSKPKEFKIIPGGGRVEFQAISENDVEFQVIEMRLHEARPTYSP